MDTTATSPGGVGDTASILDRILQDMHEVDAGNRGQFPGPQRMPHIRSARGMELGTAYVLLSQDEMTQLFSQNRDGWQLFYEQYPDAPGITTYLAGRFQ